MPAILPGATIGIFGGGQLGRMTAMAARSMGYHINVLDPDPSCAARFVVDRCHTRAFDDPEAASALASECAVVTIEIEKVAIASMLAAAQRCPVRPSAAVLEIVQDRAAQRRWLRAHGFPAGPYREVASVEQLAQAVSALGGSEWYVKAATGGYDGRLQFHMQDAGQSADAWRALGRSRSIVEAALDIDYELSILVARSPSGCTAVYAPALNHHENRILAWSVLPAPIPEAIAAEAEEIARAIAGAIAVEGLLVVEMFRLRDGRLLVNELAPRPHNTYHASELACLTSQFEQNVRAICDLPLGAPDVIRPAAIINLLGDLWLGDHPPAFDRALALPNVRLHLYGKRAARPGRKMGHLSATGSTPENAVKAVRAAYARLTSRE